MKPTAHLINVGRGGTVKITAKFKWFQENNKSLEFEGSVEIS